VIAQARKKLHQLEQDARQKPQQGQTLSLNLGFVDEDPIPDDHIAIEDESATEIKNTLIDIDPDELTPKQALDKLYQLKKLLKD